MSDGAAVLILLPLIFYGGDMDQSKVKTQKVDQFLYLDRWVDKAQFTAFVYDQKGNQKLAKSYKEFEDLTTSGIWFASKPEPLASPAKKEKQNGPLRATS